MIWYRRLQSKLRAFAPLAVFLLAALACGEQATAASKSWPDAFPKKGVNGVPESVDKLTIAVDSWGTSELNPWALTSVGFLGDYFNLRLMTQDPNGDLAPAWATEVNQTEEGLTFKINPKATFADGSPATAEAVQTNLEGFMGKFVGEAGYQAPLYSAARVNEFIEAVQVISPTEVFVKTRGPQPTFMWVLGGNGYHSHWYGNPKRLLQGPKEYLKDPAGGGPVPHPTPRGRQAARSEKPGRGEHPTVERVRSLQRAPDSRSAGTAGPEPGHR